MFYRAYHATASRKTNEEPKEAMQVAEKETTPEAQFGGCKLAIDYGEGTPSAYTVVKAENTVLDCLLRASSENSFEVEVEQSSFGSLVKSINKVTNTSDQFWMFYVNEALGQVSSNQAQINEGDLVEWRFEKIR